MLPCANLVEPSDVFGRQAADPVVPFEATRWIPRADAVKRATFDEQDAIEKGGKGWLGDWKSYEQ